MSSPDEWINAFDREEVKAFLELHQDNDTHELSLKFRESFNIPFPIIANQLRARQKARLKIPYWYQQECIIYPPLANLEQSSSELTAKFKSSLVHGRKLIDLTGGTGVDACFMSQRFKEATYVEHQLALCRLAEHNFKCLGLQIDVRNDNAAAYLSTLKDNASDTCIFIDPSRRDSKNKKVFLLKDCQPDVIDLLPLMLKKAGQILMKLSPMLDLKQSLRALGGHVDQVFILAAEGEVKELLLLITAAIHPNPLIHAINLSAHRSTEVFHFTEAEEQQAECSFATDGKYLYEPNAAIMKSGAFQLLASRYRLSKAAPNTHLYFSDEMINGFPGRKFSVDEIFAYHPKKLRKVYKNEKVNISTRNFPEDVRKLRQRLGNADGGNVYLFFFRAADGSLLTARCHRISKAESE